MYESPKTPTLWLQSFCSIIDLCVLEEKRAYVLCNSPVVKLSVESFWRTVFVTTSFRKEVFGNQRKFRLSDEVEGANMCFTIFVMLKSYLEWHRTSGWHITRWFSCLSYTLKRSSRVTQGIYQQEGNPLA